MKHCIRNGSSVMLVSLLLLVSVATGCSRQTTTTLSPITTILSPTTTKATLASQPTTTTTVAEATDAADLLVGYGYYMDPVAEFGSDGLDSIPSLQSYVDSDHSVDALNGRGDWAYVDDYEPYIYGSVHGNAFSISGEPDPNEFAQGDTLDFYSPALSPEGDLYVVAGVEDRADDVLAGAKLMKMDVHSTLAQGQTIYEWTSPIPLRIAGGSTLLGPYLVFAPCADYSRAVVMEVAAGAEAVNLMSIDLRDGTVLYQWTSASSPLKTVLDQSSDGRFVAYQEYLAGNDEMRLVVADVDAQTTRVIARAEYLVAAPYDLTALSLSPDGAMLLATRETYSPDTMGVSVFDTFTGAETPLTSDSGTRNCYWGCWLPSGERIVFVTSDGRPPEGSTSLWTMNADGSGKEQLFAVNLASHSLRFVR